MKSVLIENFQAFYYEILRQKEKALRISIPTDTYENPNTIAAVETIQGRLKQILQEQAVKMEYAVGVGNMTIFKDAQYLMVVLSDEIFLNFHWIGTKTWEGHLLEAQLFQTQIAGEYIFKKLDLLLEGNDPAREEMASLYFMALSLGFRGRYSGIENEKKIKWYQNALYKIIRGRLPILSKSETLLIKDCYQHTLTEPPGRGLPDNRVWTMIIGGVFLFYIFITYIVWYRLSSEVHQGLNLIFQQTQQGLIS